MVKTWITTEPLDPAAIVASIGTDEDGAVLMFVGTVRNRNDGRAVTGMRYDAYEGMAERVLKEIAGEAAARWEVTELVAVHRIGELEVGEASVVIAVSSEHRAESFEAGRYVIEEIKRRLPVWKQERYVEGKERWLEGHVPVEQIPGGGIEAPVKDPKS